MRLMEAGLRRSRGRHHLQTRPPARRHVVLAPPLSPLSGGGGGGACNREAAETPVSLGRKRQEKEERRTSEGRAGMERRAEARASRAHTRPLVRLGPSELARARACSHNNTHRVTHLVNKNGKRERGGRGEGKEGGANGQPFLRVIQVHMY